MPTLFVVGTPIGNLGDLSARAREALTVAARVLAEDTRRTRGLLAHLGLTGKPLQRFDAHATPERVERWVDVLVAGEDLALVTDAGMPAVSDPGAALVRAAALRGVRIVTIPGPSAVTAALAASGLASGPFLFLAFLPRHGKKRRLALERISRSEEPVVFFEAPARVTDTLRELAALMPARPAALCRELTKLHEENLHGTLGELGALEREWLGEVTIVVGAFQGEPAGPEAEPADLDLEIASRLDKGARPRDLSVELARRLGVPRRAAYARVLAVRDARNVR